MRKSISSTTSRWLRAGVVTGAVTAVVIGMGTPAFAVAVPVTLSAVTGPSAGTNTITASSTTAYLSGYTAPAANFAIVACPLTLSTTPVTPTALVGNVPATVVKKLSNLKAAITVPGGVVTVGSAATTKYNVCIYGTTTAGSALVGTAVYNVAVAPAITSISPTSGPALGGSLITVTGTGFPTTTGSITANIGGSNLLSITPISATSFTAVTPAHAAAVGLTLSVGTTAGTLNKTNYYSYTNGIVIGPNTGPNSGPIDIDVQGVGYLAMDFGYTTGSTPDDAHAHVYLVNGTYNATLNTTPKTLAEITECTDVLVVGDTELICTLQLASTLNEAAAVGVSAVGPASTARTVTDAVAASSATMTSATAAFTAADVGLAVTGTNVAANTYISVYGTATSVTLNTATTGSVATVTIGGSRTVTTGTAATVSTTALASTALFVAADVGRTITGTGIAPNTTITAFGTTSGVTLSAPVTSTIAGGTLTIGSPVAVPADAYTVTVVNNGTVGAQAAGTFSQSIVSSGSTFTVAPY